MQCFLFLLFVCVTCSQGFGTARPPRTPLCGDRCCIGSVYTSHSYHKSRLLASSKKNGRPSRLKRARTKIGDLWNSSKRWLTRRKGFTIYVLECEHNKYYVGCTINMRRRAKEHFSKRGGSKWTKKHKPVRVVKEYRRVPEAYYLGKEAQVTAELMMEHGVNNVRGAMFAETRPYTLQDISALTGFLGHFNDLHYKEMGARLEKELKAAPPQPKRRRKKRRKKAKRSDRCFYCGEMGHWAGNCPERWGTLGDW